MQRNISFQLSSSNDKSEHSCLPRRGDHLGHSHEVGLHQYLHLGSYQVGVQIPDKQYVFMFIKIKIWSPLEGIKCCSQYIYSEIFFLYDEIVLLRVNNPSYLSVWVSMWKCLDEYVYMCAHVFKVLHTLFLFLAIWSILIGYSDSPNILSLSHSHTTNSFFFLFLSLTQHISHTRISSISCIIRAGIFWWFFSPCKRIEIFFILHRAKHLKMSFEAFSRIQPNTMNFRWKTCPHHFYVFPT